MRQTKVTPAIVTAPDVVILDGSAYRGLLRLQLHSEENLERLEAARIEVWKADEEARTQDLINVARDKWRWWNGDEYTEYLKSLRAKPLRWWERLIGMKPREDKPCQFKDNFDFKWFYIKLDGYTGTFEEYALERISPPESPDEKAWERLVRVYGNQFAYLSVNAFSENPPKVKAILKRVECSHQAEFVITRAEYDSICDRIIAGEVESLPPKPNYKSN